ncbi:MAG: hypothetical protein J6W29_01055 [Neisseriaceae bacterium]|nr:hypothetical protein [Neisseriaceae bacterium]
MILIAFCFFLVLFFIFLIVLSKILGKIGNAFYGEKGKKIGSLIPLTLLACFMTYQIIEYAYIRYRVQSLCKKEAGVFVYVTPEQWKEENKDEWKTLYPYHNWKDLYPNSNWKYKEEIIEMRNKYKNFYFDSKNFREFEVYNKRMIEYYNEEEVNKFIDKETRLLVDIKNDQILVKTVYFSIIAGNFNYGSGRNAHKFLLRTLHNKSCSDLGYNSNVISQYSNQSLIEQTGDSK